MSIKFKSMSLDKFLSEEFSISVSSAGLLLIKNAFHLDAVIDGAALLEKSELSAEDVESCIRMFRAFEFNEDVKLTDAENSLIDGLDRADLPTGSYGYYESLEDYADCFEDDDDRPDIVKLALPDETVYYETYSI